MKFILSNKCLEKHINMTENSYLHLFLILYSRIYEPNCCVSIVNGFQKIIEHYFQCQQYVTLIWTGEVKRQLTRKKSARCFRTPILTSSKSFKNPSNTGTRSLWVISSPSISAISWIEKASVLRTFHYKKTNIRRLSNVYEL